MNCDYYKNALEGLKKEGFERKLTPCDIDGKYITVSGKRYLNLSSNDYLGIAHNKEIRTRFFENAHYSMGSASSRLLTGNAGVYTELENLIARLYGKESALLFNSGYHANVGIMSALLDKNTAVFSDKFNHASIVDGIKLSGVDFYRFKHCDYAALEQKLEKYREKYENAIIISESLFSMDGDRADIPKLIELKEKYNSLLALDEAHSFGVYGENGLGLCEKYKDKIDIIIGTFGKAVGSMGAFCALNGVLREYLVNRSRPLIFSTALPEINIAYSLFVIKEILPQMQNERKILFETASKLSEKIRLAGLETAGDSYIIPIILGSNENAQAYSDRMLEKGLYLLPIRHPTVPPNTARVRISLSADLDFDEVSAAVMTNVRSV